MINEITEEMGLQIQNIAIELNIIESLARLLQESIREGDNLKYFDVENLSTVLAQRVIETQKMFDNIIHILNI